jgi:hypothetical protein
MNRPPGTELMYGHIDDGSETGACGKGGCGFRTTYLGWIDCPECLVLIDWGLETGLFEGVQDGIYQVQNAAEIAADAAAAAAEARERELERWAQADEGRYYDDDEWDAGY